MAPDPAGGPSPPPRRRPPPGRSPPSAPRSTPAAAAPEPGSPAALTRYFASKEKEVSACFARHAPEGHALPQMFVRFQVAADGRVLDASVEPGSLQGTPLASCLLEAARQVRFGGLDREVRFRIPVRANIR